MTVNFISDSVYSPTLWGGTHTAFLTTIAMMKDKVKVSINSPRKTDITHIHSYGPHALYKLFTTKHRAVTVHMMPETLSGTFKAEQYWNGILKAYLRFFYNRAEVLIVPNPKTERDLKRFGVHRKSVFIPNAINTTQFAQTKLRRSQAREKLQIAETARVILSVGHLIPRKGATEFIRLASMLPEYTFVWVGGKVTTPLDANWGKFEQLSEHLPKNLILTGEVAYDDMPLYYNAGDIFLLPSHYEIGSMAVLEAAACGLPLLLRDLPEYKELYGTNFTGCSNTEEFASSIKQVLQNNTVYDQMVAESNSLADMFSFETVSSKLLHAYTELMQS